MIVTLQAHCIPTKLFYNILMLCPHLFHNQFCMYHLYTIWCLYVLCTFTTCMLCTFTTCMLACSSWYMYVFICHVPDCFPSPSPHSPSAALGSVKCLETILLFWRYIYCVLLFGKCKTGTFKASLYHRGVLFLGCAPKSLKVAVIIYISQPGGGALPRAGSN